MAAETQAAMPTLLAWYRTPSIGIEMVSGSTSRLRRISAFAAASAVVFALLWLFAVPYVGSGVVLAAVTVAGGFVVWLAREDRKGAAIGILVGVLAMLLGGVIFLLTFINEPIFDSRFPRRLAYGITRSCSRPHPAVAFGAMLES